MDGKQVECRGEIEEELIQYFEEIMDEDIGDRGNDIAKITRLIPKVVTRENNEMPLKLISMQEMEEAVNQVALGKASGPDGFTTDFFHSFWDMIKEEILEIMEELRYPKGFQCHLPNPDSERRRS